jgi:hypothetical protein
MEYINFLVPEDIFFKDIIIIYFFFFCFFIQSLKLIVYCFAPNKKQKQKQKTKNKNKKQITIKN